MNYSLNKVFLIANLSSFDFHDSLTMLMQHFEQLFHFLKREKISFKFQQVCFWEKRGEKKTGVVLLFVPRRLSLTMNNVRIFWSSNSDEEQQIAQTDCMSDGSKNFLEKPSKMFIGSFSYRKIKQKIKRRFLRKKKATINFYEATLYTPVSFKSEDSEEFLFTDIVYRQENLTWYLFDHCFQWSVTGWCCRSFAYHFTNDRWSSKFSNTYENQYWLKISLNIFKLPCLYAVTMVDLTVQ